MSDIQQNYCITLDGYPFLKVFPSEPDMFSTRTLNMLCHGGLLRKMLFRINISEVMVENTLTKKCTSVSPYFIDFTDTRKPGEALILEAKHIETYYLRNKTLIETYIKYQLINSGILDVLPNIPITDHEPVKFYEQKLDQNKKFIGWLPSPRYDSCICVRLNPNKVSLTSTAYHNDSNLFQILQYSREKQPYVLGSELLFYHDDDTVIHRLVERNEQGVPFFPEEKMGNLIHSRYELVKKIYQNIRDSGGSPPILRHKLNNGDTMVFPDTLLKHAVIDSQEKRDNNILHIKVSNIDRGDNELDVIVCSERLRTVKNDYDGRSVIGLFCFLNNHYMEPEFFLDTFSLMDYDPLHIDIIDVDAETCQTFLQSISNGNGCVNISNVKIINRGGGKYRTKKNKNKHRKFKKTKREITKKNKKKRKTIVHKN